MSSITINSNIAALNAQRRLGQSTRSLQDSFTRLSSGLRINKASDDAAGLAISESLKADQRVLNQGVRNLNDGVSLISIADGALAELSNITIRLTELAEQSANGALGNSQRAALDEEGQALKAEFFRISKTTEFNGQKLFEGTFGELTLQAGFGEQGGIVSGLGGAIGDGTLQVRASYEVGISGPALSSGDLNGDGILDVITGSYDGRVNVLLGNGDGTFQSRASYVGGSLVRTVALADLNGDGVLDIVSGADEGLGDSINVLIGNGDGTFKARASYSGGLDVRSVTTADVNGDGVVDIVAGSSYSSNVSVLIGNGDGTFEPAVYYAGGNDVRSVSVADVNGDEVTDIISSSFVGGRVNVHIGNGDGTFKARVSYAGGDGVLSVTTADFNGDGVPDIISGSTNDSKVNVLIGNGDGTFQNRVSYAGGTGVFSVAAADLNGDGVPDIISGSISDSKVNVLVGNGDGTFKARASYSGGFGVLSVAAADLNGDGVLDVLSNDGADSLGVYIGNTTDGVAPLLDFSLATMAEARQALPVFEQKLDQLAAQRGQLGAFEARLSTAISTVRVTTENIAAAGSQITDADVAAEAATLVRNQILQQAGAAVLAQANQAPALALLLLNFG